MPAREGSITVTLRRDSEVIKQIELELSEDGTANTILPFTPARLGRSVYTVSIPLTSDDAVVENNERAFLVRVTRDKLRVLLVCGAPSWDSRFLRAFLKSDPSIDLITFFILRTSTDITMAPPEELSLIPFPTEELFREHLDSFDLVIFQDFNYGPYQMRRYLPRIRDYVQAGGAFAMIGGSRAFGAGGYIHTPIAQILPVTMAAGGELIEGEFRPVPAAGMVQHPVIGLLPGEADNLSAWGDLAPLIGANRLQGVTDRATALLRHPTVKAPDGQGMVVLAVGSSGDGRTLALGSDTSWRWGIATAGQQGDASAYERFWDRALRWLTRDPILEPSRVETDRERYGPEGDLGVQALVRDDSYQPRAGLEVRLEVLDEAGAVLSGESLRLDEEGRVSWAPQAPVDPGAYRVALRAEADDRVLAEEGFVVEAGGDELADVRPRPSLLREVSEVTKGTFFASPEDAPGLEELDRSRTRALGTVVRAPFASPWFFLVVALLLATEWSARRAWGLR